MANLDWPGRGRFGFLLSRLKAVGGVCADLSSATPKRSRLIAVNAARRETMIIVGFFVALALVGFGVLVYVTEIRDARRRKEEIDWYGSLMIADVFIFLGLVAFTLAFSQLHWT